MKQNLNRISNEQSVRISFNVFLLIYLFSVSVESTGALPPEILVEEAIKILHSKCQIHIQQMGKI